ncbi:hypothetical protein PsorP6_012182 [Peronosclerospora sorghi]|uniref:Uncharacterized protein n=1 Tax=Peronosclerospora sorghi TaxID=230839 RepID=A0ACC0WIG1_9STRA|nr:hypothetical protein PsorP6_012182 [Peronosclerospora sorghi]
MAVTRYHVILLFPRHVQVVSKLSGVVVLEESFDSRVGNLQRVLTAQEDNLFEKGDFDCAAVIYAKTTRSFEEVALKFLEKETRDSLSSEEKTQKTVLCSWIVEIFLDKFNALKGSTQDVDAHANLLIEFKQFLQDQKLFGSSHDV